ncbi:MAG: class I SAM-dependent methyltransferase [Candidatus Aminicenantes bacterium]|nr:class I SAM-dependent methyltransferase [Candidatus Aminicenantes bacterium]
MEVRDRDHQPDKVMDIAGLTAGMVIGEVGAGEGYFTFKLAARVGPSGKVYANDVDARALRTLAARAGREGFSNIETIVGEVENPLLPSAALDMVFMVNVFHDLTKPVGLLRGIVPSLKPGATVVILDRDPAKFASGNKHNLPTETILALIKEADFELLGMETFFRVHNLYIIRPLKTYSRQGWADSRRIQRPRARRSVR